MYLIVSHTTSHRNSQYPIASHSHSQLSPLNETSHNQGASFASAETSLEQACSWVLPLCEWTTNSMRIFLRQICTARTEVYGLHLIASRSEDNAGNFNLVLGICLYSALQRSDDSYASQPQFVPWPRCISLASTCTCQIHPNTINCVRRSSVERAERANSVV